MMNEHIAVIAQIESRKGVENAEEIISADGVDAIMIGVGDLRFVFTSSHVDAIGLMMLAI